MLLAAWRWSGFRPSTLHHDVRAAVGRWTTDGALRRGVVRRFERMWAIPSGPGGRSAGLAAMVPLAAALACWTQRARFISLAGILLNLSATLWWFHTSWWQRALDGGAPLTDLLHLNVIALTLPAPLWLWIDRRMLRAVRSSDEHEPPWLARAAATPFQRFAAWVAVVALGLSRSVRTDQRCVGDGQTALVFAGVAGPGLGDDRDGFGPLGRAVAGVGRGTLPAWVSAHRGGSSTSFTSRRAGSFGPARWSSRPTRSRRVISGAVGSRSRRLADRRRSPRPAVDPNPWS